MAFLPRLDHASGAGAHNAAMLIDTGEKECRFVEVRCLPTARWLPAPTRRLRHTSKAA